MKSFAVSTLLALLLIFNLSSAADVAELRRLRKLGTSGHTYGGDNGRDHPGVTTPAPVVPEVTQEQEDTVASTSASAAAPANVESEIVAMESGSSNYNGCQIAYIVLGVLAGVLALAGVVFLFFSNQAATNATNNRSVQTVAKGVPAPVPTREHDEETLEDMSSASDSPSQP